MFASTLLHRLLTRCVAAACLLVAPLAAVTALAQTTKPNILVIMGDDVGWFNIGAYHQGIMSGKTPNLDKLAAEGMRFTDYYAEASCTAGRANFITGELPIRTGLTTVGQAGADVGMPDEAVTLATVLKSQGYATGQFGKNHLGDLNKYLPTRARLRRVLRLPLPPRRHVGPVLVRLPAGLDRQVRPAQSRAFLGDRHGRPHRRCRAGARSASRGSSMKARWRRSRTWPAARTGRKAARPSTTWRPSTRCWSRQSSDFMDKAKKDGKPFFIWHNTTRMHVFTYIPPKYQAMMNYQSNYGLEEAGMAQMDDSIGELLKHLEDIGEADNTIVIFTTDNGAEVFTWPDGGMTPFRATKGTVFEGGFRVPAIIRWPGKVKPGTVENGIFSGLDWLPTLAAAAGNPDITEQLLKGVQAGRPDLQEPSRRLRPDGPAAGQGAVGAARTVLLRRAEAGRASGSMTSSSSSISSRWAGPGEKVTTDMPTIVNIRQDPFERTPSIRGETLERSGRRLHERLLCPRVLALRSRAAAGGGPGEDGHRLSADAGAGQLQPRSGQGAGRGGIKNHEGQ